MATDRSMPVSTKTDTKLTPTLELELFAVRLFHSISPMDARLASQEESINTFLPYINDLQRLTVFFLMEQKRHVDRLAALCKADRYFAALRFDGTSDFLDISMNLSSEAEIEFVGNAQSPEGRLAQQILIGIDMMMSIHNIKSISNIFHLNKALTRQEIEGAMRETFLIMRNLGFFILVKKLTSRDVIDTEIASIVIEERHSNAMKMRAIREYDANRYRKSSEASNQHRNSWFSERLIPLIKGRRKGGGFNIKDRFIPFLEGLMADTGANDLLSVCATIKETCKETEPLGLGEMIFYWDDESDAGIVRAVWLNNKKERKDKKIALKTLGKYIKEIQEERQRMTSGKVT